MNIDTVINNTVSSKVFVKKNGVGIDPHPAENKFITE
jgi:hypothetical protein